MDIAASELQNMLSINRRPMAEANIFHENIGLSGAATDNPEEGEKECGLLIENMVRDSERALALIERSVESTQERFLEDLRPRLSGIGINLDERMVLSLTENGELLMEGAFSGVDDMEKIADVSRDFSDRFRCLAAMAAIMNKLELACEALRRVSGEDAPAPIYKACLKGRLSHFYMS